MWHSRAPIGSVQWEGTTITTQTPDGLRYWLAMAQLELFVWGLDDKPGFGLNDKGIMEHPM
jgi:hypothetical protein